MSEPVLDEQGRPEPPLVADEEATLLGFLDFLRATIWVKTSGLSDDQLLSRPLETSMTLGGLLKHLSFVEGLLVRAPSRGKAARAALGRRGLGRRS